MTPAGARETNRPEDGPKTLEDHVTSRSTFISFRAMSVAVLGLALLAGATVADAQSREDRWEFTLGAIYQLGADLDFEGGSTVATDDDFGFLLTTGYNFSDKLETSFGFQYGSIGYDANVIQDDGDITGISGSYDNWALSANVILNLMDGPLTPYIGGGLGWTWIDTNVPNGLPTTGCWWDPWYGYICYTDYPTKSTDAMSYQATLGLRYEFPNDMTFMRFGYTSQWLDLDNSNGTPRFDVIAVEIGWMF
jgi:opacity protein-like surface antigen